MMSDSNEASSREVANARADVPASDLRARAEFLAAKRFSDLHAESSQPEAVRTLLHELRVHQIELEMQNEDLLRTQERLEESRAIYFDLYDLAPIGYCTLDDRGLILRSNLRAAELLGSERASLAAQAIVRFIAHRHRGAFLDCLASVRDSGVQQSLELQLVRSDGTTFWAEVGASAVTGSDGVRTTRLVLTDASERRAREEQLHKLSLAVEQSPDAVIITDVSGQIEYVNDAFVRSSGYDRSEAIGANMRILKSTSMPAETYKELWASIAAGQSWQGELINRRKDGGEYVDSTVVSPLRGPEGVITHYVSVQRDITEKKRLREELARHRDHLEELVADRTAELAAARTQAQAANAAKSAFLANMSHEIRTPMNAIIGLSLLLRRSGATPDQVTRLDKIDAAGRHLLAVINDVLDLSKIEAGRVELEAVDFDLSTLFEGVTSIIGHEAKVKGLDLVIDLGSVPRWLNGDSTRLRQALLNFVSNAVKFTEQGTVRLSASLLGEAGDELHVRFAVDDSGVGIAPEDIGKLFGLFEQVDASTTRKHGGSGLGLAITKRLAALMNGEVGVDSAPGRGSTFWFTAKLRRGGEVSAPALSVERDDTEVRLRQLHGGTRILLAEDNPINQWVAMEMLGSMGLSVDAANNGLEAVQKARSRPYDLVLMDMQMPVMDGLEATRAIRALPNWEETPIFALTANAFGEDRQACIAAGMDDFVSKPVEWSKLWSMMLERLSSRPRESGSIAVARNEKHAAPEYRFSSRGVAFLCKDSNTVQRLERLALVDGLDLHAGLSGLRGNAERFLDILIRFVRHHAGDAARLNAALTAGDREEVRQQAHSLRGAALVLGAMQVGHHAGLLEDALRAEDSGGSSLADLRAHVDGIENALVELAAAVAHIAGS